MPDSLPSSGFNCAQSIELRVAGIDYLEAIDSRSCLTEVFNEWFAYMLVVHGIPKPTSFNQAIHYEDYIAEYKQRILRTIRWHATHGRSVPSNPYARRSRIRILRCHIMDDIRMYERLGIDLCSHRPPIFQEWFEETIRGWSIAEMMENTARRAESAASSVISVE
ncbi:hypothetical protein NMY22_g8218 [Coprinellus aureogranulatus]|nr:hypothetical protein NMY22_g8218 [Coprinellus aureogranulatus]